MMATVDPASDPTLVGTWVLIALAMGVAAVVLVNGILSIVRHFWPGKPAEFSPQPLTVKAHVEYTPLADHLRLTDRVEAHRAEALASIQVLDENRRTSVARAYDAMRAAQTELRNEMRDMAEKTHARLNNHGAILGEIRGELKNLNKTELDR